MKHLLSTLILACLCISAQAQESAIYVYRNDGHFNAFLTDCVDSMTYSPVGLDGVVYDTPVVQEIWTADSLYRIPIAAIDSIGYQTPEPIMKEGIFIVDEGNENWVVEVGSLRMVFSSNTPASQRPQKGQIIYSDLETDMMPMGFSGRVTDVTNDAAGNYVYTCQSAGPDEVYDLFIAVGRIDDNGNHLSSRRSSASSRRRASYSTSRSLDVGLGDYLKLTGKVSWEYEYYFYHNIGDPEPMTFYLKRTEKSDFNISSSFEVAKLADGGWIPSKTKEDGWEKEYYLPDAPLFNIGPLVGSVSLGIYAQYSGNVKFTLEGLKYTSTKVDDYTWYADNPIHIEHNPLVDTGGWDTGLNTFNMGLTIAGSLSTGVCCRLALQIWKPDWLSLNLVGKVGPEIKGSFTIDTKLLESEDVAAAFYTQFSENVKATSSVRLGIDLNANYKGNKWKIGSVSTNILSHTVSLLPKLSTPQVSGLNKVGPDMYKCAADPLSASVTATQFTLLPGRVGLTLTDANGKIIRSNYNDKLYALTEKQSTTLSLKGLEPGSYTVYPRFNLVGVLPLKGNGAQITIPQSLTLSNTTLEMKPGDVRQIRTSGGWGQYSFFTSNKKAICLSPKQMANGSYELTVTALAPGDATITVRDVRTSQDQTCDVSVQGDVPADPDDIYPTSSYKLSADGTVLLKWEGNEKVINMRSDPAFRNVTTIGKQAFMSAYNMETLILSDRVTTLEEYCCRYKRGLKTVKFPKSVKKIGNQAFFECYVDNIHISDIAAWCAVEFEDLVQAENSTLWVKDQKINHLIIPEGVTTINEWAFCLYKGIKKVTLPTSLKVIGDNAFYLTGLTALEIPGTVETVGATSFGNCEQLATLKLNEGIKTINGGAFYNTAIATVTIPNSVTTLGWTIFSCCKNLASVQLPRSISTLPLGMFEESGLKHITIPSNIKTIDLDCFENCTSLESVTFSNGLKEIGSSAFKNCSKLITLELPSTVENIGALTFKGCSSLESIVLPHNYKYVGNAGSQTFGGCINLKKVYAHMTSLRTDLRADMFETYDATLYVPRGLKDLYSATLPWSQFKNIVEANYEE